MRTAVLRPVITRVVAAWALVVVLANQAGAWGPHPEITRAALAVLPDAQRWNAALGAENVAALANYSWMPDQRGQDLGAFYADDYLLIRQMPRHVGHVMPEVQQTFVPYFRRALLALRTETPVNACRQLGPLIHFVEDAGAPPHAKEKCPHHSELENWLRADQITIAGYQPQLLGQTDEAAEAGLLRRMAELVAFSKARAERALPLVSQPSPDRSQVEPIVLESALESARVLADVLHTVFTLGLAPQPEGASLSGTVTAGPLPLRNNHGARIVLLDTDYATLATTIGTPTADGVWKGEFAFHHLRPGTYRLLAYRTGSQSSISEVLTLEAGKPARLNLTLKATDPVGNVIENPDGRLAYLLPDVPDRWRAVAAGDESQWISAAAWVKPEGAYRVGAVLKDPQAEVSFHFTARPGQDGKTPAAMICELVFDGSSRAEQTLALDSQRSTVVVQVRSSRPLAEAIEKVWVVPEVSR
jgi:hypothetical protein